MLDNDPEPLDRCRLFRPNAEDRNHFEALVPRIYELGGKLPDEMVTFHNISTCPPAKLPADPTDMKAMMNVLLQAEQ